MRPVPTRRAVVLAAVGLVPAVLAVVVPSLALFALAIDVALLVLVAIDFLQAPRPTAFRASRVVEPILSAGVANQVTLVLELAAGERGPIGGEIRDSVMSGPVLEGQRQSFVLRDRLELGWKIFPQRRGDLDFGDLWVRVSGPLGLCFRQFAVPAAQRVKVYPDLTALTREALALARASDDAARRVLRRPSEGRELESLREYRPGDDRRTMDWKATARRARPMVRVFQPERNQTVLLLLDCGRHMAGQLHGRRKLEHAVDAALRLAKVSLDQGDLVGVLAFAGTVQHWLPARRGADQLRAIAHALYRVEASLTESDYGAAIDLAFARASRRALVVLLTDVMDPDTSASLIRRTLALVPRHLPLVASLFDDQLEAVATAVPLTVDAAYQRQVAARLETEYRLTAARLRDAGARVVRAPASSFGAATVNAYLDVKARGVL